MFLFLILHHYTLFPYLIQTNFQLKVIEPPHDKTNKMTFALSEHSD